MFNPMAPIVPGTTVQETMGLYGLAALLADPKAVMGYLEKLQEEKNAAHEVLQQAEAAKTAAAQVQADAAQQRAQADAAVEQQKKARAEVMAAQQALGVEKAALVAAQAQHAAALKEHQAQVDFFKQHVASWETGRKKAEADFEARQKTFDDKVDSFVATAKGRR